MSFLNYGLATRSLDKYLKSGVSQYPSTSNIVKAPKHISHHHGGRFMMLIYHR